MPAVDDTYSVAVGARLVVGNVVTGTNISFSAPNIINDADAQLSGFSVGEKVEVSGSLGNDATYEVSSATTSQIVTVETTIVTETAGAVVSLIETV